MKRETRHPIWSWIIHTPWVLAVLAILATITFFGSGAGNPFIRRLIVHRLESATGGRAELQAISIRWLSLRFTLKDLIVHGKEPAGTEPLFSADEVQARLRIDSFWGRKVSLTELILKQPHVHIRVERNGTTNVPAPPRSAAKKPLRETLFDLRIRRLLLEDGWILYNNVKTPLATEGNDLVLSLDASGTPQNPLYLGNLEWHSLHFTRGRDLPLPLNVSARFTLWREGFTLEQGVFSTTRSHIDAQAEMNGYTHPRWTFRYRGWLDLLDFRETFRSPLTPSGRIDVRGEGSFAGGKWNGTGSYSGHDIDLRYTIFRANGLSSRGSYRMDDVELVVPDFSAQALGGTLKGRVNLRFAGLEFRAETHLQNFQLSEALHDVERPNFPVEELHWDALLSGDTVETWTKAFENFDVAGKVQWSAPESAAPRRVPVTGTWRFRYRHTPRLLNISSGEFETSTSQCTVSGVLAPRSTALDVRFEAHALEAYKDFINAIRGAKPGSSEAAKQISGSARWEGKISGPSGGPTFGGRARGERVQYDGLAFDAIEGDVTYSPAQFVFASGHARFGTMDTQLNATLALVNWNFLPDSAWTGDANFDKAPIDMLQQLLGSSYPVQGVLSGQLHGRGTRAEPSVTGLFDLADGKVYGMSFNRLRGRVNLQPGEVQIADAELRVFPPGKESGRGAGIITGSAGYRFTDGTISADLVGASLPLENVEALQFKRLPIGGIVTFRVKASGLLAAPQAEGTFRVVDLKIGQDAIGSFDGNLSSDGRIAKLELGSAMTTGGISGGLNLGLADPYPLNGKVSITNISLDPFLITALHLEQFTGHGVADGDISVAGTLKEPEKIVVDGNFSRVLLNYEKVQLENAGPVHLRSSKESLEIVQAALRGTDTNLQISGTVLFSGRRSLGLKLNGALDMRLLTGFVPSLDARGPAQINASFEGTLERPRITGRVHIENAYARVTDFPTGMSNINGDLVFDATRLFFEDLTAESGGGTLHMSGSVSYTERPLRYDVTLHTDRVRIRYPEGMSWLAGGTLRLTGTTRAGVLSGRVTIERVTLSQGLEVAGMLVSAKEGISGPATSSPFLRNLQFDIAALSSPDARMEWPGAELEAEADLRVRGTWEHPILLGHIHILSGDLTFRGGRYRVTRGDLNFANPFRLDPVVNVEATTTIQQYEITLDFTGPASKLTLAYRSDPPLPANDIVTLLALGQTSSEASVRGGGTAPAQSATSGASAILSEAISSQLGGRLERLFGITRLRVDPGLAGVGSTTSGQNAGARVTVEQQVTRNLTITYVSNVSSTQQQVIQVEYNVDRNVSIVALRDQNGTFGIDIKIKKHFQ